MELAVVWLIVFLFIGLIFLIILIFFKYFYHKRTRKTLFGDSAPYYFKGIIKRLNPFLIVRKKGKEFKLRKQEGTELNKELVVFDDKEEESPSEPREEKPAVEEEGFQQKITISKKPEKKQIVIDGEERERLLRKYKPRESSEKIPHKKGLLIKIDDLNSLSKKLNDKDMVYVLDYLKKENYSLIEKLFLGKTFDSENEFIEYLKEEIARFLESEVNLLKNRLSDLRKKGIDVSELTLKVMSIPLKIKIFSASFNKKDFDRVVFMINKMDSEIKEIEKSEVRGNIGKEKPEE